MSCSQTVVIRRGSNSLGLPCDRMARWTQRRIPSSIWTLWMQTAVGRAIWPMTRCYGCVAARQAWVTTIFSRSYWKMGRLHLTRSSPGTSQRKPEAGERDNRASQRISSHIPFLNYFKITPQTAFEFAINLLRRQTTQFYRPPPPICRFPSASTVSWAVLFWAMHRYDHHSRIHHR